MDLQIGELAKCKITGFEGVIVSIHNHLYGCKRISIAKQVDGVIRDEYTTSHNVIEKIGEGIKEKCVGLPTPKFKPGLDIEARDGSKGKITIACTSITMGATYIYQPQSEDGKTIPDVAYIAECGILRVI